MCYVPRWSYGRTPSGPAADQRIRWVRAFVTNVISQWTGRSLRAAQQCLIKNTLMRFQHALCAILAASASFRQSPENYVNAGPEVFVGLVRHRDDPIAGRILVLHHPAPRAEEGGVVTPPDFQDA